MGTTTPNYSFFKPDSDPDTGDFVNVDTDLNDNWDIVDTELKNVSDATTLNRPIAQLRNTTATSIPNGGSGEQVVFQTEDFDSHNGHDSGTNPTRWTCPSNQGGTYKVSYKLGWTAKTSTGTSDIRAASIFKNGAEVSGSADQIRALDNGITQPCNQTPPLFITLVPGDYLELHAFQNSGGALNTFVAASGLQSTLTIEWVRA